MSLYQALPSSSHIRLLKFLHSNDNEISLQMFNYDLDSKSCAYSALSYVWGSPDDTMTIKCNGQRIKVRKNLHHFLSRSRRDSALAGIVIWIDALCINQTNIVETESQVAMMGRIYQQAAEVLIELGEGDQALEHLVKRMQNDFADPVLAQYADQRALGKPKDPSIPIPIYSADELRSFIKLVDLRWFRRVWTLQELVLAEHPKMMLGDCTNIRPLSLLRSVLLLLWDGSWEQVPRALVGETFKTFLLPKYTRLLTGRKYAFHTDFHDARGLDATDPRDHVYGVLGISQQNSVTGLTEPFQIVLKESFEQIMLRMSSELVKSRHADWVLWNAQGLNTQKMPSWTATVSGPGVRREAHDYRCACERGVKTMSASTNDKNQFFVQGFIISTIQALSNAEQKYPYLQFIAEADQDSDKASYKMMTAMEEYMWSLATWFDQMAGDHHLDVKEQIGFSCSLRMSNDIAKAERLVAELKNSDYGKSLSVYKETMAGRQLGILGSTKFDYRICNVPRGSAIGDVLVVIPGSYWPYVLRHSDTAYVVIGPAYVPVLMDLEQMTFREDFSWSDFKLQDLVIV